MIKIRLHEGARGGGNLTYQRDGWGKQKWVIEPKKLARLTLSFGGEKVRGKERHREFLFVLELFLARSLMSPGLTPFPTSPGRQDQSTLGPV